MEDTEKPWYSLPETKSVPWIRVSLGVAFVSFLQPALTNYAMFQISLALLLTLESIGPLYSLPLSLLLQNERPTYRACLGAILAVAGIAILSFKGVTEAAR
jgi:drug/metabolite transporter (DMT)-like permease